MLLDARNPHEVPITTTADTVIVGAGTVGLLLAISLARANKAVILVEAGGRVADTRGNGEAAESVGKHHSGVLTGRAAGLGGTSVLWGGQLAEFGEEDLRRKGFEWPVSYMELRRWYEHIYDFFGIRNRRSIEDCRLAFGGETDEHPNIERFFTLWLAQPNFATYFRREIMRSSLIRIVMNATVNEITFSGERAQAVYAQVGGRRIAFTANNFVFAAGTIQNNRFFLSAQRLDAVPWKRNVHIGKYFQDHLGGKIADVEINDEQRFRAFFENGYIDKIKLQPKLRFARKARAKVDSGVCGLFVFNSIVGEHISNVKMLIRGLKDGIGFAKLRTLPKDLLALNGAFAPLVLRYLRERRILAFLDGGIEFHVQAEQIPFSESKIHLLSEELGRDGLCRVAVDWQVDGHELVAVRRFFEEAEHYLEKHGIAHLRAAPPLKQNGVGLIERLGDTGHQCGGLRMASRRSEGVTDINCRVWDTTNVYVAGASVFPTSSHANCTLTALALTARLAHQLLSKPF